MKNKNGLCPQERHFTHTAFNKQSVYQSVMPIPMVAHEEILSRTVIHISVKMALASGKSKPDLTVA